MLNLVTDAWIPVRSHDGSRTIISPWQMADPNLDFPDWPRPDLNIACLELLIGLVFLADPPRDADDWRARRAPDPERLRAALAPHAPAFELLSDGPRFMQDFEALEDGGKVPNPPDMLFIDSAGGQTLRNNADLMVRRGRYPQLDAALAAMALYALQAHAPSGGKGNRTSMRGGGPMVTLVDPGQGLWPLIWSNVPDGAPQKAGALPWMRQTRTSEKGEQVFPQDADPVEAFFGMPRRLRLIASDRAVTGVLQKPYGTNYAGWEHPLTPHYRQKEGGELFPRHPQPGAFGYRQWLGINAWRRDERDMARRARVLDLWGGRSRDIADAIVAGWAMDNMKPRDFILSRAPLIDLPDDLAERMEGMVNAAEAFAALLRYALAPTLAEGTAREAVREAFFVRTQSAFEARLGQLETLKTEDVMYGWLTEMRDAALDLFDAYVLPGLGDADTGRQAATVQARRSLGMAFAGYGKTGRSAFHALGLPVPEQRRRVA